MLGALITTVHINQVRNYVEGEKRKTEGQRQVWQWHLPQTYLVQQEIYVCENEVAVFENNEDEQIESNRSSNKVVGEALPRRGQ